MLVLHFSDFPLVPLLSSYSCPLAAINATTFETTPGKIYTPGDFSAVDFSTYYIITAGSNITFNADIIGGFPLQFHVNGHLASVNDNTVALTPNVNTTIQLSPDVGVDADCPNNDPIIYTFNILQGL